MGPGKPAGPQDGREIVDVQVFENTRTSSETVIAIAGLDSGDTWTAEAGEQARVNLESSGLFKDVNVYVVPLQTGVRVVYIVHDKFSWVIAPIFSYSPGNVGGGLLYGENNLFGENKKLLVVGDLTTGPSQLVVGYLDPNLFGTPWFFFRADASVVHDFIQEYDPAQLHQPNPLILRETPLTSVGGGLRLGINWFRAFKTDAWLRASKLWIYDSQSPFGAGTPQYKLVDTNADTMVDRAESPNHTDQVSVRLGAAYDRHANIEGVLIGPIFELAYEQALSSLGSTYRFHVWTFAGTYGLRFFEQTNLVLSTFDGVGADLPFHQELVAGGSNLRGYFYRQLRGDHELSGSANLIFPLFHISSLFFRGVLFYDTAAVWFAPGDIPRPPGIAIRTDGTSRGFLGDQNGGFDIHRNFGEDVGIGLRLYLRSIVLPLLGVDLARGVENGSYQVVLSLGVSG